MSTQSLSAWTDGTGLYFTQNGTATVPVFDTTKIGTPGYSGIGIPFPAGSPSPSILALGLGTAMYAAVSSSVYVINTNLQLLNGTATTFSNTINGLAVGGTALYASSFNDVNSSRIQILDISHSPNDTAISRTGFSANLGGHPYMRRML